MVSWADRIDDMTKKLITRVDILRDRMGMGILNVKYALVQKRIHYVSSS
jgi:hypothetical protein